jgi:hypothetical protein
MHPGTAIQGKNVYSIAQVHEIRKNNQPKLSCPEIKRMAHKSSEKTPRPHPKTATKTFCNYYLVGVWANPDESQNHPLLID